MLSVEVMEKTNLGHYDDKTLTNLPFKHICQILLSVIVRYEIGPSDS